MTGTRGPVYAPVAPNLGFEAEPWMDAALCAQVDPDLWFPPKGGSTRPAKSVCAQCDVIAECLRYAIEHDERHGVWGGTSAKDRSRRRSREQAA